jgi:CO dehydrogenase maturation factor
MSRTIAVTGKGGVGKTVVSCLTIRALLDRGEGPILAVDADPNMNLDEVLGVQVGQTVGGLREGAAGNPEAIPAGMSKAEYFQLVVQQSLVECEGFDLLAMGRPEGPGCYCYANNVLRQVVDGLAADYPYVVMDCEAGLEHISRRTTTDVDALLAIADPTMRSVRTAARVKELIDDLETRVGRAALVLNRVVGEIAPELRAAAEGVGMAVVASLPEDAEIRARDETGRTLLDVPDDNPVLRAVDEMLVVLEMVQP